MTTEAKQKSPDGHTKVLQKLPDVQTENSKIRLFLNDLLPYTQYFFAFISLT